MIKQRVLAATLAALIVASSISTQAFAVESKTNFKDIKGHWAEEVIEDWADLGIVSGDTDGNFNPNYSITRKDFCVILNNILGLRATKDNMYSDIETGAYYAAAMMALVENGIIKGDGSRIRPNDTVTREESAVIIGRAFSIDTHEVQLNFNDKDDISYWAEAYVAAVAENKIMQGDTKNRFNPKKYITRAEVLKVLDNVVNTYVTQSILENKIEGDIVTNGDTMTYRGLITKSTVYSISEPSLDIVDSMITGKVVTGATQIRIENSTVEKIIVTSDKANIVINGTVKELMLRANNAVISGDIKGSIKLRAGNTLVYNGKSIKNNTKQELAYTQEALDSVNFETDSLKVNGNLSSDNKLNISIEAPISTVEKYGILINNSSDVPVYTNSDEKCELDQAVLKRTARENILDRTLKTSDIVCYRAFSISANGTKIEYGKPMVAKAYEYNVGVYLDSTSMSQSAGKLDGIYKNMRVTIEGSNIPEIKSVEIVSSTDDSEKDSLKYTKTTLASTEKNEINIKKTYKARIRFNVTQYGEVSIDKYYGYKVTMLDNKVIEVFPVLTDESLPSNTVKSIKTGTAKFDSGLLVVENNSFDGDKVIETGILTLCKDYDATEPEFISVTDGWIEHRGEKLDNETVTVDCGNTANKKIYYAFYVKTDTGASYGQIKTIMGQSIPVYTGNMSADMNTDGTIASLKLQVETVTDIDMQGSYIDSIVESNTQSELENYTNKTLESTKARFSGDILKITLIGLTPNTEYTMSLKIQNSTGISDDIVIQFRTTI